MILTNFFPENNNVIIIYSKYLDFQLILAKKGGSFTPEQKNKSDWRIVKWA